MPTDSDPGLNRPHASAPQARILPGVMIATLVLVAIYAWQHFRRPPAPAPPLEQAERSELALLQGRLCRKGQTNSFTGWITERYTNGVFMSRSMVSNGLLHGVSEGWHPGGAIQVREFFTNGVSHGIRTKWYTNGAVLSVATISNGVLQGPFRRWTEQGTLAEYIEMSQGKPHGRSRAFYPGGSIKVEAELRDGEVIDRKSYEDGQRQDAALLASLQNPTNSISAPRR